MPLVLFGVLRSVRQFANINFNAQNRAKQIAVSMLIKISNRRRRIMLELFQFNGVRLFLFDDSSSLLRESTLDYAF